MRCLPRTAAWMIALLGLAFPAHAQTGNDATACAEGRALTPGLCVAAEAAAEGFSNITGGVRTGVTGQAIARVRINLDFNDAFGLPGWRASASALGVFGRQPTATLIGSLAAVSNLEALPTVRLEELWLERDLGDFGSIRAGNLAADREFAGADAATPLGSAAFGWSVGLSAALPSGGPAYPFALPGVRLALGDPDAGTGVRLGAFFGDPGGRRAPDTDPQRANRYGLNFPTNGGTFLIAEAVTGAPAPEPDGSRPWVVKLGGWVHTGSFESPRRDTEGGSVGDPTSSGAPRRFGSNHGAYGIVEATFWRGEASSLAGFGRLFLSPPDRSLIAAAADVGLAWRGPFGRAEDTVSIGIARAFVGGAARGFDRDLRAQGEARPLRAGETVVEAGWEVGLVPGRMWVRPSVQWINAPAAGEPDERFSPEGRLPDAVALAVRLRATL